MLTSGRGPLLPPEQFMARFPGTRRSAMDQDLTTGRSRADVRGFFRECLREHSRHWYGYRILKFDFEADLAGKLEAYRPVDKNDPYDMAAAIHDLKLLRRKAFQRYAFGLAAQICRRLSEHRVSRLWTYKDFALPRVPLALAVGYGVVLGSFKDWLMVLGKHGNFAGAFGLFSLVLSWFLIYCNVRDRIGERPGLTTRAWAVFGICTLWSAALLVAGRSLATLDSDLNGAFEWGAAVCLACSSLLVAILVQFFFAKDGSIADPL